MDARLIFILGAALSGFRESFVDGQKTYSHWSPVSPIRGEYLFDDIFERVYVRVDGRVIMYSCLLEISESLMQ